MLCAGDIARARAGGPGAGQPVPALQRVHHTPGRGDLHAHWSQPRGEEQGHSQQVRGIPREEDLSCLVGVTRIGPSRASERVSVRRCGPHSIKSISCILQYFFNSRAFHHSCSVQSIAIFETNHCFSFSHFQWDFIPVFHHSVCEEISSQIKSGCLGAADSVGLQWVSLWRGVSDTYSPSLDPDVGIVLHSDSDPGCC